MYSNEMWKFVWHKKIIKCVLFEVSICTFFFMIYDMIYDIWYDMIWYDMIWYDMIWYDMIWYMYCSSKQVSFQTASLL